MTPEQELELFQTLGRMEAKLDATNEAFVVHTNQDLVNFTKLENGQEDIYEAIDAIQLRDAKESGIAEEAARHASASGGKWGAAMGAFVSVVVTSLSAYFGSK